MARIDMGRILGAVLSGAATPSRRRRRRDPLSQLGFGGRRGSRSLGVALATLAGVAIEALAKAGQAPPPRGGAPAQGPAPYRPAPDTRGPARRIPETGGSLWSPTVPAPPEADAPGAESAEALLLVRAMIAAAKADGAVDAEERGRIAGQLDAAGLTAEEREFVLADFDRPMTPEDLAREARDPMLAAQLYAAAFAAAGDVTPGERAWLDRLARELRLDRAAAQAIEARLGGAG